MGDFMARHQVALYLLALSSGVLASFLPGIAGISQALVTPALALLLLATFLSIPLNTLGKNKGSRQFTQSLLLVNFGLVPLTVAILVIGLQMVAPQFPKTLVFTAALILLTPCVDYVVTFAGLAGGSQDKLLARTPLLLLTQIAVVPAWLLIFSLTGIITIDFLVAGTLVYALPELGWALAVVGLPFIAALLIQRIGGKIQVASEVAAETWMVPLMMLVLGVTPAAHASKITQLTDHIIPLASIYAIFAIFIWGVLYGAPACLRRSLTEPEHIALTFSGITRNALVALPIILGISSAITQEPAAALMPLAVLTQTLIELLALTLITGSYRKQKLRHLTKAK